MIYYLATCFALVTSVVSFMTYHSSFIMSGKYVKSINVVNSQINIWMDASTNANQYVSQVYNLATNSYVQGTNIVRTNENYDGN